MRQFLYITHILSIVVEGGEGLYVDKVTRDRGEPHKYIRRQVITSCADHALIDLTRGAYQLMGDLIVEALTGSK